MNPAEHTADTLAQTIIADIIARPELMACASYSELHDHCDANCLGEQETLWEHHVGAGEMTNEEHTARMDRFSKIADPAQAIVHEWLTSPERLLTAQLERFALQLPAECVIDCSHAGPCDADVDHWADRIDLTHLREAEIHAELREYGAWESDELEDEEDNLRRIIWIAACNIKEELKS